MADRDRWNDTAIDLLADRVNDIVHHLAEFREETSKSLGALTRERNGKVEPAPGKLGIATWISLLTLVVVPIVVAIISTSGH